MKSLEAVAYSIRDAIKGQFSSDDERIDIEFVYDKIWDVYSKLKEKYYKQNGYLDPSMFSQRCCLDIKCRSVTCDGFTSPVKEFYIDLPALESAGGMNPIIFLGSDGFRQGYHERSVDGMQYKQYDNWVSGVPSFVRIGQQAILENLSTSSQTKACMIAVLEEPGNFCKPEEAFPGPRNFIYELELMVKKDILSTLTTPDIINNANDLQPRPQQPQRVPQQQTEE